MKILHIDTEKTWRGGEQQVLYLLKGLREKGHHSTLICQPGSALAERAKSEDIFVDELPMRGGVDPFAVFSIAAIMKRGFDIVHMHTSNAHTLGYGASFFSKVPKLVASRRVSFPVKGLLGKLKYSGVDKVIAVSEEIRQGLIASGLDRSKVVAVHSSIDLGRFDGRKSEPDSPTVGIFAHLARHKGHSYFFDAAAAVLESMPDVNFMVVGDGDEREALEAQVGRLGISSRVKFQGFSRDVPHLLKECTITVLSSISGEGSPGVIKESMAAAVPVVTTDVGGSAEVVENGVSGIVVPAMDSNALAEAMLRLLKDPGLRASMREEGVKRAARFSTHVMVDRTESIYKELLGEK